MDIFGRLVFGSLGNWFGKLHYRFEIMPHAKEMGYTREQVYRASLSAHKRAFDEAWPSAPTGVDTAMPERRGGE